MVARIYSPAKSAMQSGRARTGYWILENEPEKAKLIDPLMGYTSTIDVNDQCRLAFDTLEEAIEFAKKGGIPYRVEPVHRAERLRVSYSDNFRSDRQKPWTH